MQRRLGGIVRAKRERLNQLAMTEAVHQWQALMPLVHAHLQADQQALQGGPAADVEVPDVLTPADVRLDYARDLGLPVVPVTVTGAFDLMRKGSAMLRPGHELTVYVDDPIETAVRALNMAPTHPYRGPLPGTSPS